MTNETADREQALRAALQRWLDAAEAGDIPAIEELLTPEFTYTHATSGISDSRDTWLNIFRPDSPAYRLYPVYQVFDLTFRFYAEVAVVCGRGHQEILRNGAEVILNTSFTQVWVETEGGWKLVTWQATRTTDA